MADVYHLICKIKKKIERRNEFTHSLEALYAANMIAYVLRMKVESSSPALRERKEGKNNVLYT
ncbi:MAG: hypothetical protein ACFFAZ_12750 [Promethearchaeota archaeon]